jgi:hypothetical protein
LLAKVFENRHDAHFQKDIITMSEEAHHLVELALGTVEALMAPKKQPKVILFDIGGVCVSPPAILYPAFQVPVSQAYPSPDAQLGHIMQRNESSGRRISPAQGVS